MSISGEQLEDSIDFSDTFDVNFKSPCDNADLVNLTVNKNQVNPSQDDYSGSTLFFTYRDHNVSPSYCQAEVKCRNVSPIVAGIKLQCQELSNGDNGEITWTFDETDYNFNSPPGTYTYTFDVTVGQVTDTFTFDLVLTDPCNADVVQTTKPNIQTYTYYITDSTADDSEVLSPKFAVNPSFCATMLDFSAPGLESFAKWDLANQQVDYTEIIDSLKLSGPIDSVNNPELDQTY